MAGEHDAEHVERLALVPVRGLPDRRDGRNRLVLGGPDAQPHARVLLERVERVGDAEARAGVVRELRVVDAAEIDEVDEAVVLEGAADFDDAVAVDEERDLADLLLRAGDRVAEARDRGGDQRIALDLVDAAPGGAAGAAAGAAAGGVSSAE